MNEREAPEYSAEEFRGKSANYCVCIFVLNEVEKLHKQLDRMRDYTDGIDVVIADGGSTDGSVDRDKIEPLGVNTVLIKKGPGKLGAQIRMACDWALKRGYDGIIVMDGNNKDGPEALPRFVEALQGGVDHVQGSRFIPGGVSRHLPKSRWIGLKLLHAPLISLASRRCCTDTTNGFRAYSKRFLSDPRVALFRDVFAGYELHYYLAIRAARLGFNVTEIPVSRVYPSHGPIPTKISPLRGNLRVIGCLLRACLGLYNPH